MAATTIFKIKYNNYYQGYQGNNISSDNNGVFEVNTVKNPQGGSQGKLKKGKAAEVLYGFCPQGFNDLWDKRKHGERGSASADCCPKHS